MEASWACTFLGFPGGFVVCVGPIGWRSGFGQHYHKNTGEAAVDFELRCLPGIREVPRQVRGARPIPTRIEVETRFKTLQ